MLKKLDPIEEASKQAETIDSPRIRERSAGPPKIPRLNLAAVENIHPFLNKHAYQTQSLKKLRQQDVDKMEEMRKQLEKGKLYRDS
jgi:hypothetical protein